MMMSGTRSAIVTKGASKAVVESSVPMPKLQSGEILVRTTAFALNPVDQAFVDYMAQPGTILGCDYAGVVVETAEGVDPVWEKGMRVAGYVHGSEYLRISSCPFTFVQCDGRDGDYKTKHRRHECTLRACIALLTRDQRNEEVANEP